MGWGKKISSYIPENTVHIDKEPLDTYEEDFFNQ